MTSVTRHDVNRIADTISSARVTLDQLMSELDRPVWSGPDADRFRARWESEVSAQLRSFERATRGMSIQTYYGN